jgi:DNA-binding MarR family transcriptional regulator
MSMQRRSTAVEKPIADLVGKRLSTATIMFHSAVADRMGLSVTDAKCRSILVQLGPMTAGVIAQRLGLTTGAVTGVIDRLVAAKLVRRVGDPADRRRVVVEWLSNPRREREIAGLFEPMGRRISTLVSGYSQRDQAIIAEFLTKASEVLEEETTRLCRAD